VSEYMVRNLHYKQQANRSKQHRPVMMSYVFTCLSDLQPSVRFIWVCLQIERNTPFTLKIF